MITLNFDNPAHIAAILFCVLVCILLGVSNTHDETPDAISATTGMVTLAAIIFFVIATVLTILSAL